MSISSDVAQRSEQSVKTAKTGLIIIIVSTIFLAAIYTCFFSNKKIPDSEIAEETESGKSDNDISQSTSSEQLSAFEAVNAMSIGWNLGNTLDSIDNQKRGVSGEFNEKTPEEFYETYWGNPITTAAMINKIVQAGFGAIRIPVTYADHMDDNFQIRPEWLERVKQVVDYVLDNDVYCIINIHHDTGSGTWPWLNADADNIGVLGKQFESVWKQIAEYFKEYDDKLLFESFNEILDRDSNWSKSDRTSYSAVNQLNQIFVDTVRSIGGNNSDRLLVIKSYSASVDKDVLNSFSLPMDSVKGRLIFSFHYYGTQEFILNQEQAEWADTYANWDYGKDGKPVELTMMRVRAQFPDIPVIIGEFGAQSKGNTADRVMYATHFIETARKYGITCFWWDTGGWFENADAVDNYALFDRYRNQWFFPEIVEAMVDTANNFEQSH